ERDRDDIGRDMRTTEMGLLAGVAAAALFVPAAAQAEEAGEAEASVVLGDRLEESTPEELERYGSRLELIEGQAIDEAGFFDTAGALQFLAPGLFLTPKSGAFDYVQVSLQGSRTNEVLFLTDGVRINNRLYGSTSPLDSIPASMIERIEVLKGGQGRRRHHRGLPHQRLRARQLGRSLFRRLRFARRGRGLPGVPRSRPAAERDRPQARLQGHQLRRQVRVRALGYPPLHRQLPA